MMSGDKDAYCEYHKLYVHATAKCYKLKGFLAVNFVAGELEESNLTLVRARSNMKRLKETRLV